MSVAGVLVVEFGTKNLELAIGQPSRMHDALLNSFVAQHYRFSYCVQS